MLEICDLTVKYGNLTALESVSFQMGKGIYGLIGPNGAGKSTLMNVMTLLLRPDQGCIRYKGKELGQLGTAYLERIGYMPQHVGVYKNFTAEEFLLYLCTLKKVPGKEAPERCAQALARVNLADVAAKKIGTFSGGMKQRLGIAQAIVNDPEILILDEPTAGLDPEERLRLRNLLNEMSAEKLILLSTHIISDVEYSAKEIVLLEKGRLILKSSVAECLEGLEGCVYSICADDAMLLTLSEYFLLGSTRADDTGGLKTRVILKNAEEFGKLERIAGGKQLCAEPPRLEDVYVCCYKRQAQAEGAKAYENDSI